MNYLTRTLAAVAVISAAALPVLARARTSAVDNQAARASRIDDEQGNDRGTAPTRWICKVIPRLCSTSGDRLLAAPRRRCHTC